MGKTKQTTQADLRNAETRNRLIADDTERILAGIRDGNVSVPQTLSWAMAGMVRNVSHATLVREQLADTQFGSPEHRKVISLVGSLNRDVFDSLTSAVRAAILVDLENSYNPELAAIRERLHNIRDMELDPETVVTNGNGAARVEISPGGGLVNGSDNGSGSGN